MFPHLPGWKTLSAPYILHRLGSLQPMFFLSENFPCCCLFSILSLVGPGSEKRSFNAWTKASTVQSVCECSQQARRCLVCRIQTRIYARHLKNNSVCLRAELGPVMSIVDSRVPSVTGTLAVAILRAFRIFISISSCGKIQAHISFPPSVHVALDWHFWGPGTPGGRAEISTP